MHVGIIPTVLIIMGTPSYRLGFTASLTTTEQILTVTQYTESWWLLLTVIIHMESALAISVIGLSFLCLQDLTLGTL